MTTTTTQTITIAATQAARIALASAVILRENPALGDDLGTVACWAYANLAKTSADIATMMPTTEAIADEMRAQVVDLKRLRAKRRADHEAWMARLDALAAARPPIPLVDASTNIADVHAAARVLAIETSFGREAILVTMREPVQQTDMDSYCWDTLHCAFLCQGEEFFLTSAIVQTSPEPIERLAAEVQHAIDYCIEFGHDYGIAYELFCDGKPITHQPAPFTPRVFA